MCFIVTIKTKWGGKEKITTPPMPQHSARHRGPRIPAYWTRTLQAQPGEPVQGTGGKALEEATSKGVGTDRNVGRCLGVEVGTQGDAGNWGRGRVPQSPPLVIEIS